MVIFIYFQTIGVLDKIFYILTEILLKVASYTSSVTNLLNSLTYVSFKIKGFLTNFYNF